MNQMLFLLFLVFLLSPCSSDNVITINSYSSLCPTIESILANTTSVNVNIAPTSGFLDDGTSCTVSNLPQRFLTRSITITCQTRSIPWRCGPTYDTPCLQIVNGDNIDLTIRGCDAYGMRFLNVSGGDSNVVTLDSVNYGSDEKQSELGIRIQHVHAVYLSNSTFRGVALRITSVNGIVFVSNVSFAHLFYLKTSIEPESSNPISIRGMLSVEYTELCRITRCSFFNNTGDPYGAAMLRLSKVTRAEVSFTTFQNSFSNGGSHLVSYHLSQSLIMIHGCIFENGSLVPSDEASGGCIVIQNSGTGGGETSVVLQHSIFRNCKSETVAGAILLKQVTQIMINNVSMTSCSAKYLGGALMLRLDKPNDVSLFIKNSTFQDILPRLYTITSDMEDNPSDFTVMLHVNFNQVVINNFSIRKTTANWVLNKNRRPMKFNGSHPDSISVSPTLTFSESASVSFSFQRTSSKSENTNRNVITTKKRGSVDTSSATRVIPRAALLTLYSVNVATLAVGSETSANDASRLTIIESLPLCHSGEGALDKALVHVDDTALRNSELSKETTLSIGRGLVIEGVVFIPWLLLGAACWFWGKKWHTLFPSLPFRVSVLCLTLVCNNWMSVVLSNDDIGSWRTLGILSVAVYLLPFVVLAKLVVPRPNEDEVVFRIIRVGNENMESTQQQHHRVVIWCLFRPGAWFSRSSSAAGDYLHQYGFMFQTYNEGRGWYMLFDVLCTYGMSVGYSLSMLVSCEVRNYVILVISGIRLVSSIVLFPHHTQKDNVLSITGNVLEVIACGVTLSNDEELHETVKAACITCVAIISLLKLGLTIVRKLCHTAATGQTENAALASPSSRLKNVVELEGLERKLSAK